MAYASIFDLVGYENINGLWRLHFIARTPTPGDPVSSQSDVYVDIPESELPANINQGQLTTQLKQRLGWKANQTFAPLNTFIANGTTITLP